MAEPLLAVSSIVVAFIAGLIGGYFIGWTDAKSSKLIVDHLKRLRKMKWI